MPYELIITEKPNAAKKIADSLADGKAIKENISGVPYYKVTHGKKDLVIACAVGHLYTVAEKDKKTWTYPVFDVEWVQTSDVSKGAAYTAKYVSAIRKLSKDADEYTLATDYDIEGEVIGYNIIKYICKQKDARRMKFSTLTKDELVDSYEHASPTLDWGQVHAGTTRHVLDFFYGINLSRALTLAVKSTGSFKILSSGRVQGPALKIIVDKEREIKEFKPVPFWQLQLLGKVRKEKIEAWHIKDKFWEKKEAEQVLHKTKGKDGIVENVEKKEFEQSPPTPFDLTTLQTEAYRCFGIQPSHALDIAQNLYLAGAISYPRTSSQKLPCSIGYKKILNSLEKNSSYKELAVKLLSKNNLKPHEGEKTDPAHPAIYPTGIAGKGDERGKKIYDLIVKRFLATFAEPAKRETVTINIDVNKEIFVAKGTRTISKGWHEFYAPYVNLEEEHLPKAEKGDKVDVDKITIHDKETQPPKRYTPASIIKELEKRNLGTKSTRANIVDTLFHRGYVSGPPIEATVLGMQTVETLEKYCPSILDEELTRQFEEEMEEIREHKKKDEEVLDKAKDILTKILAKFKHSEKEIGKELLKATREADTIANTIGQCPVCKKGTLKIRGGKFGRFIACDQYPKCKTTFKLPSAGKIKNAEKLCERCNYPIIIISRGKRPQNVCINPNCPSKKSESKEGKKIETGKVVKKCPKCGKDMVLRRSVYGEFLGCSGYPACRHIEKMPN